MSGSASRVKGHLTPFQAVDERSFLQSVTHHTQSTLRVILVGVRGFEPPASTSRT